MDETKPGGLSTAALADQRNQYNLLLEQYNKCCQENTSLRGALESAFKEQDSLRQQLAEAKTKRRWLQGWERWRA